MIQCPDIIINKDKYDLGQSETKSITDLSSNININLNLNPFSGRPFIIGAGRVIGTVKDDLNNPIGNAVVTVMTSSFKPLFYNNSDASGEYSIDNIPPGVYRILANVDGKKSIEGESFVMVPSVEIKRDFVFDEDSVGAAIITGSIVGGVVGGLVGLVGIAVALYFGGQLIGTAITGAGGQYVFGGLVPGLYTLTAGGLGYISSVFNVQITNNNEVHEEDDKELEEDPYSAGTISGVIIDNNSIPINRADVVLYQIFDDNIIPVDYTKTNINGVYLFKNIPIGEYLVKSTEFIQSFIETTSAPYFKSFSLDELEKSNLIENIDLFNGAKFEDNLIKYINKNKGYAILNVEVPKTQIYSLNVEYLCDELTTCNIDINGDTIDKIYEFRPTSKFIYQIKTIKLYLIKGRNKIKIYNK